MPIPVPRFFMPLPAGILLARVRRRGRFSLRWFDGVSVWVGEARIPRTGESEDDDEDEAANTGYLGDGAANETW